MIYFRENLDCLTTTIVPVCDCYIGDEEESLKIHGPPRRRSIRRLSTQKYSVITTLEVTVYCSATKRKLFYWRCRRSLGDPPRWGSHCPHPPCWYIHMYHYCHFQVDRHWLCNGKFLLRRVIGNHLYNKLKSIHVMPARIAGGRLLLNNTIKVASSEATGCNLTTKSFLLN